MNIYIYSVSMHEDKHAHAHTHTGMLPRKKNAQNATPATMLQRHSKSTYRSTAVAPSRLPLTLQ